MKPVTILIAAMGGEGGGVLADWLVDAATHEGLPVQSTSVPGVAQRTGATTYYVEIYPCARDRLDGREPVLALTPQAGCIDLVAATELVEAGRMLQGGFVHPDRTTLVGSTHREYAISEKTAMGDGRYDSRPLLQAATRQTRRAMLFDMRQPAQRSGSVINTVLFGAMLASGRLPLSRAACEAAIRRLGKAVDASLRGFEAGFDLASAALANDLPGTGDAVVTAGAPPAAADKTVAFGRTVIASTPTAQGWFADLDAPTRTIVTAGAAQVEDYQDAAYSRRFLARVQAVHDREHATGAIDHRVTRETARYLALWMSFEDLVRVADLKTRVDRLARVRREVGAGDDDVLRLTEVFKPGLDEWCSVLPPGVARRLRAAFGERPERLQLAMSLRTDTVTGFALLCFVRALRPLRRFGARFAAEQAAIERWLQAIDSALARSPELAHELALCGNLVKGYGETHARGHRHLGAILDDVATGAGRLPDEQLARVQAARRAALADVGGRELARTLGMPAPQPRPQPIRVVRRGPRHEQAR